MAEEGQRTPTPEEFALQYLADNPEGESDLSIPDAPMETETVEDAPVAEEAEAPEVEAEEAEATPPTPEIPNPLTMSREERRTWLANATPEEKALAITTHANPDDIIFLTSDYSKSKNELASEKQKFEQDRETIMTLLAQQQQVAPTIQPPPPPQPEAAYDPYAPEPDPRVTRLEKELAELRDLTRQQQQAEGLRLIKDEMRGLTSEHPWFTESDHELLFAEMRRQNIPNVTAVFRTVYFDRLLDEAVTKAAPKAVAPVPSAAPEAPPLPPPTRAKAAPTEVKIKGTPEEFARSVVATGNAKGADITG